MREIKFKAKRSDNDVWIEGDLLTDKGGSRHILPIEADFFDEYIEVKPETVCQFTGLQDKNGEDIYEGDIIKHYYVDEFRGFIKCEEHWLDFYIEDIVGETEREMEDWHKFEVIGNIHDKNKKDEI